MRVDPPYPGNKKSLKKIKNKHRKIKIMNPVYHKKVNPVHENYKPCQSLKCGARKIYLFVKS